MKEKINTVHHYNKRLIISIIYIYIHPTRISIIKQFTNKIAKFKILKRYECKAIKDY